MLLKKTALMVVLSLLFLSCSNSPSSNDDEEAPSIPSLETVQPDLSYFQNNSPQKANKTATNFNTAKGLALTYASVTSFGQIYAGFFQGASQSGGELQDGAWVWDYNYSYGGESASMVLTSRESGNEIIWDMTISYSGPEGNLDDYTMLTGKIAKDGMNGSWTFNSLSTDETQEVPLLISTWEKQGDSNVAIETEYYGDEGSPIGTFTYTQDQNDFMLTTSDLETGDNSTVHWNTDTETGYYETNGEQKCWDSNFQDTSCS